MKIVNLVKDKIKSIPTWCCLKIKGIFARCGNFFDSPIGNKVRNTLAWISVALAIPMAGAALYDSIIDAAWEEKDDVWEQEDVIRHQWIMSSLVRIENRCAGGEYRNIEIPEAFKDKD